MENLEQKTNNTSFWNSVKKGAQLGYCCATVIISTALGALTNHLIRNDFIGQCELVRFTNDMSRRIEPKKEYYDPTKKRKVKQIVEGVVAGGPKKDPRGFIWLVDCTGLAIDTKDKRVLYHTPKDMSRTELKTLITDRFDLEDITRTYVMQGGLTPERDQELKYFFKNNLEPTSMRIVYDVLKDLDLLDETGYINYQNKLKRRPWIFINDKRDFLFAEYGERNGVLFYKDQILHLPETTDLIDFRADHLFRK